MKRQIRSWFIKGVGVTLVIGLAQSLWAQQTIEQYSEVIDTYGKATQFKVNASKSGESSLKLHYSMDGITQKVMISVNDGLFFTTVPLPATGGWQQTGSVNVPVQLTAGDNVITVTPLNGVGGPKWRSFYSSAVSSSSGSSSSGSSSSGVIGQIVQAEDYHSDSLVAPYFVTQDDGRMVMTWNDGSSNVTATDETNGQLFYYVTATAPIMTLFSTVNFSSTGRDSFHHKLEGQTPWTPFHGGVTEGYEELTVTTWSNLTVGQTYSLKIQRRERNAKIDALRVEGGEFIAEASPTSGGTSSGSSSSGGGRLVQEAESFDASSPAWPFFESTDSGRIVMTWDEGSVNSTAADDTEGQLYYPITATAPTATLHSTVNFTNGSSNSFHHKLEGHTEGWTVFHGRLTEGYEEQAVVAWNNLTIGQTYLLKIQRRELNSKLDSFRLVGAEFE